MIADNYSNSKTSFRVALEDSLIVFVFVALSQLIYCYTQTGDLPYFTDMYISIVMGGLAGVVAWAKCRLIDLATLRG